MPRTDLTRIHRVVAEVRIRDSAVLIADLTPTQHLLRIKLHLHLHIAPHRLERAGEVVDQGTLRFLGAIDVVADPIALVGQLLEQGVVVVVHAHTDRVQVDALLLERLHTRDDLVDVGLPSRRHTIREEHHAVHACGVVTGNRRRVAQLQTGIAVGAAFGLQRLNRLLEGELLRGRSHRHDLRCFSRELDDRHLVASTQLAHKQA